MESLWSVMTIVGPLLLLAVLVWAVLRNRASSSADLRHTEEATHKLRDQLDADEHRDEVQR